MSAPALSCLLWKEKKTPFSAKIYGIVTSHMRYRLSDHVAMHEIHGTNPFQRERSSWYEMSHEVREMGMHVELFRISRTRMTHHTFEQMHPADTSPVRLLVKPEASNI